MKREIIDASKLELEDKVVAIKRVTKVVKGGRNSRVAALVVVGDRNGHVGVGVGKEVPPRVEYSLTPRAETLIPIMDHLIEWALDNMAVILKDRDKAAG